MILSPIIAHKALFPSQTRRTSSARCYLAVAFFVVFYYVPLSEAGDGSLEAMARQRL
jgi:hypothetical protein